MSLPQPAAQQADQAEFSAAAALLNLTGLGLGYLIYGRVIAVLVSWVGAFLLIGCAGAWVSTPGPWLAVAVPWVLVQAVHGGAVPEGRRTLIRLPGWLAALVAGALIVTIAVGGTRLASEGREVVAEAAAAHAEGDCVSALSHLNRLGVIHVFGFADTYRDAAVEREQCEPLVAARAAVAGGAYPEAVDHYLTYVDRGGAVDISAELDDTYAQVTGLIGDGGHCEALPAVERLAVPARELPGGFQRVQEQAGADHPTVLLECAKARYGSGDLDGTGPLVEALRARYPDHELTSDDEEFVDEVVEALIVRDIETAAAGEHNRLGAPQATGTAPAGEVVLVVGNDSIIRDLELLYTGPVTGQVIITTEEDCAFDPASLTLPPGDYRFLVRVGAYDLDIPHDPDDPNFASRSPDPESTAEPGPPPLYGTWALRSGTRYLGCFEYSVEFTFD